ncbi:hypothetical protein QQF64_034197 [Cirrhinus molitorella]|uniref:Uncharacterized protein n=1 Tax=Cirrhinus molitorella TaxID=172907 RepID=A0ABR3MW18_9TELE
MYRASRLHITSDFFTAWSNKAPSSSLRASVFCFTRIWFNSSAKTQSSFFLVHDLYAVLLEFPQATASDVRAAIRRKCNNEQFVQKKRQKAALIGKKLMGNSQNWDKRQRTQDHKQEPSLGWTLEQKTTLGWTSERLAFLGRGLGWIVGLEIEGLMVYFSPDLTDWLHCLKSIYGMGEHRRRWVVTAIGQVCEGSRHGVSWRGPEVFRRGWMRN